MHDFLTLKYGYEVQHYILAMLSEVVYKPKW